MMVNIEIYWRHAWGQNTHIYCIYILYYIYYIILLVLYTSWSSFYHPSTGNPSARDQARICVEIRCKGVEKLWTTGLPVDSQSCLGVLRNCWNDQTWSNHIKPSTPPRGRSWTCNSKITLSNRKTAFQTFSLFHVAFTGRIFRYLVSCDP